METSQYTVATTNIITEKGMFIFELLLVFTKLFFCASYARFFFFLFSCKHNIGTQNVQEHIKKRLHEHLDLDSWHKEIRDVDFNAVHYFCTKIKDLWGSAALDFACRHTFFFFANSAFTLAPAHI